MMKEKVMQFLMKLRPEFEPLHANILNRVKLPSMDKLLGAQVKLPSMDKLLGELLREKTRLSTQATLDKGEAETAFVASKTLERTSQKDFSKVQCFECREFGHVASCCKKKNACVYCKQSGHIIIDYLELKQKGINSKQKSNHRVYQATSFPCSESIPTLSSASSATNNPSFVEGKDSPISNEVQKLLQNSVSSTITSAFSAIGLSGPLHLDSEREGA
ncbi:hypothetical protein SLEP1_g18464 [Rubroshorea leprosula]|uniref:CCHC-type domain-containing protein n=1 Tax=Rubroshorea leprosula TaxID=152421 RepID=A0AAV5IXH9_9ROSI|nr:hypothetical protein SLEP1_g18464 [Rubroshorea leprosula]